MIFNFETYIGKYVMNCKTEQEAEEFCALMQKDGRKWENNTLYDGALNWRYGANTCYIFNEGKITPKSDAILYGYVVLEWETFKHGLLEIAPEEISIANNCNDFIGIAVELADTLDKKNADYGSSYEKQREEFPMYISMRLSDKLNRIKQLQKSGKGEVANESMRDTLMDLAGYALLEIHCLDKEEE